MRESAFGCLVADAPSVHTPCLFYSMNEAPPAAHECFGRKLLCIPRWPRAADGSIDIEALTVRPMGMLLGVAEYTSVVDTDAVLDIVNEVLARAIDKDTSFLAAGLSSLKVMQLLGELQKKTGDIQLTAAHLFEHSSARQLAKFLTGSSHDAECGLTHDAATTALNEMVQDVRVERNALVDAMSNARALGLTVTPNRAFSDLGLAPTFAIIGSGGHAHKVILEIRREERCSIVGVFDDNPAWHFYGDVEVKGATASVPAGASWLICIGQNETRHKIATQWGTRANAGVPYWPTGEASVAESAEVGPGTFIAHGVYIGPNAKIGKHCIINPRATLGHDAVVEDYAFVGGGAMLGGGAVLSVGAVLGMGAIIAPKRRVGAWSTVMINSAVVGDIPAHTKCGGVPAYVFGPADRTAIA